MPNNSRPSKAVRWSVLIAVGFLLTLATGLLVNWQLAPFVFLLYFVGGWAVDKAQKKKKKKDTDAYREDWLNKRKGSGSDTEGKGNGSLGTPSH